MSEEQKRAQRSYYAAEEPKGERSMRAQYRSYEDHELQSLYESESPKERRARNERARKRAAKLAEIKAAKESPPEKLAITLAAKIASLTAESPVPADRRIADLWDLFSAVFSHYEKLPDPLSALLPDLMILLSGGEPKERARNE